jgi:hypothetical protein
VDLVIANADIVQVVADLVVLKHADGFYGADRIVAKTIGFEGHVPVGQVRLCNGTGLVIPEVAFIGVGPLHEFRYEQIQEFGSKAIKLVQRHPRPIGHLALTAHGPGYGLDPEQAFLSLVAGIVAEWRSTQGALKRITIAELSAKRSELFGQVLRNAIDRFGLAQGSARESAIVPDNASVFRGDVDDNVVQFGARAEGKARLFVAMPFAETFLDEYHIGFCEAARASSFICERLDVESFTGDIVAEIKKRILVSDGVLALLNDHNPNVFLEIGFALAHNKPTILVAREGIALPFDVSGQRCIS